MPGNPLLSEFAHRVVDPNSGAEVVGNLPHLGQTLWKVRGLQPGLIGSATLGEFEIPLHAPAAQEAWAAEALYDKLAEGQRIETYIGSTGGVAPYRSGVITKIDKPLDQPWVIRGFDSLWWLQQSQVFLGEQLGPGGHGSDLVNLFGATREVVFDNWCNTLTFLAPVTSVTSDPQFGLPGVSCAGSGIAMGSTSWNAGQQYNLPTHPSSSYASAITLWGVLNADTNVTHAGSCGIFWLSDAGGNNAYFAEVEMVYQGSAAAGWNVTVSLWTVAGGVFSQLGSTATPFANILSPTLPFQLSVTLSNNGATGYNFHVFLNGKDTGLSFATATLAHTSGVIGIRFSEPGTNTQYATRLRFEARTGQYGTPGTFGTNRFQVTSVTTGTAVVPIITGQSQTHLDLLELAMSLDGFEVLVTPGRGPRADSLTYGNLGTDLSAVVRLVEGENVVAQGTALRALADQFATVTRYSAVPGDASGGTIEWPSGTLANVGDLVLTDTVADVGAPGSALQFANAMAVAARKSNPLTALQIAFYRSADVEPGVTFKLYDSIQAHLPSLRLNHAKQQVIGWDVKEGDAVATVYLNQFSEQALPRQALGRVTRVIEWLAQHQS